MSHQSAARALKWETSSGLTEEKLGEDVEEVEEDAVEFHRVAELVGATLGKTRLDAREAVEDGRSLPFGLPSRRSRAPAGRNGAGIVVDVGKISCRSVGAVEAVGGSGFCVVL